MSSLAEIELDLAYGGPDPLGEERWTTLLTSWLAQLQAELPAPLQAGSYSLGLQFCDDAAIAELCLLYTSPSPRDYAASRMPSSA